ncbi:MAG: hypothetical protein VYA69_06395 [Gemmatimonadota bacterium]|nr:hypothetical protein [Gemmatimonadota bacterium]
MDAAIDIPDAPRVTLGAKPLVLHDTIAPMRTADDILDDTPALNARIEEDENLFLRGFNDRDEILAAWRDILGYMSGTEFLASDTIVSHEIIGPDNKATNFPHRVIHEHFPTFLSIIKLRSHQHPFPGVSLRRGVITGPQVAAVGRSRTSYLGPTIERPMVESHEV